MKHLSLRSLATEEASLLGQNLQAKQILNKRVLKDNFSVYNPKTKRYWKVIYTIPKIPQLNRFLSNLGYKQDENVVPLDYFQILYLDYFSENLYRINVKRGVLMWEAANGFFIEKTFRSLPHEHEFKVINHLTQKSSYFFALRDFYEYFPLKFSTWKSNIPQELVSLLP